jgi:hypothetical protein
MRGLARLALMVLVLLPVATVASAHEPRSFSACTLSGGECLSIGAAFVYGDEVVVRGKVRPAHAGMEARVLRRDPHASDWTRVGTVTVSDTGKMRFVWQTEFEDAVQDAPYLFRFKIPDHGRSTTTEAYVLFGE